jgi:predicted alpha/beta-hydrolase family hydrolase
VLLACLPGVATAGSARMELELAPGIVAEADYWPGEADRPAVLILHGFLQTREFPTVRRLAQTLAGRGFSVLTPSLTLGIDRRARSLACEAIHTHSMQRDIAELRAWTAWLAERTGKPPVLIGHGSGGTQLAALLDAGRDVPIARSILIAPSHFAAGPGAPPGAVLKTRATAHLARGDETLGSFALGHCRRYLTTPTNLLSYLDWDIDRLRTALVGGGTSVAVVYGDGDGQIDAGWLAELGEGGVALRAVVGANHLLDLSHEGALFDEVVRLISGGQNG